jgi:hypothetical protein
VLDAAASNINVYFGELHGFLQVRGIGLFGKNRSYLHLETYRMQEIFLSQTTSMLTGKKYTKYSSFYHLQFSSVRYMCFSNLAA